MKIVHIISNLGNGGAERLVVDLATAQSESGNDVTVFSFRDTLKEKDILNQSSKLKLITFSKKKGIDLKLPFLIHSFLKKENPDVVNCHLPSVFLYVIYSMIALKKTTFFYTIHNNPIQEEPRFIIRCLRKYFIIRKRLVPIAISKVIGERFKKLYKINDIVIIDNGRKKLEKGESYADVFSEIQKYKKDENTIIFIAVGRISKQKNHKLLVNVFSELEKENVILLIVGNDYGFGILEECIKVKANNTFFIGSRNNVADYLFCSDVFCMSSIYEGLPISILEAMSVGLPIISTNVGGISDVVKEGENGFLIYSLEVKDYLSAINKYLHLTQQDIQEISENNKKTFKNKYDIIKTSNEYLTVYQKYL